MALEVKSLDSALEVRGRILHAFEAAELKPDEQEAWLTFLVVGAGPTGVEMAGQIAELANDTLPREYRAIDTRRARVLLVETADKVLAAFPDPLPDARRDLARAARRHADAPAHGGRRRPGVRDRRGRSRIADPGPDPDGRVGRGRDRLAASPSCSPMPRASVSITPGG